MLQEVKRTIFYACRAFGFSLARKPEGGYAFVPNAAFDRERHGDVLRWAEEKIAETKNWAAAEEAKILAKRRDTEEWVALEIAKVDAKKREAEEWVGVEEYRIAERGRETKEWIGAEESRIAAQRREAEEWIGSEESRITAQRREAEEWVGTEENRVTAQRREAEEWVGAEEDRITSLQRDAAAWVGDDKSGAEQAEPPRRHDTDPPPDGALLSAPVAPLAELAAVIDSMRPWSGRVPEGCLVDAVGAITRASFRPGLANQHWPEREVSTQLPTVVADGEGWFEFVDWVVSAREAKDDYVAVSLGAAYGSQLVGAWKALQRLNPLPSLLIAVEAVPENCRWIETHMRDNGIAPEEHVIIQAAVGPDNEVVLFPVGAPGSGLNNAIATNAPRSRATYAQVLSRAEHAGRITRNLLMRNTTGLVRDLGEGAFGEVKFVSAVTLGDILGPLRRVDLLEVDIQQSEVDVIPPFIGLLTRKVRRIHIGTHGASIHGQLRTLFIRAGWEIVFDYAPDARHDTELGSFTTSDGILTARNPGV
jgi:Methyltransferase FkbM domain